MKDVNLSLISKLGWQLLFYHNSLWVLPFQQKYIRYGNFLSSYLTPGSWIWNGIKATLPFISACACFIPSSIQVYLSHLFFTCLIVRVQWRHYFWTMDTVALNVTNITDWLHIILHPEHKLGLPQNRDTSIPNFCSNCL